MRKKLAIMSLCFTTLMYLVLTVSVAGLLAAFPGVPESRVLLVLTLPNLTAIAGILLVPLVTPYLSDRALSLLSLLMLIAGGGLCMLFHDSLPVLLAAAAVMGAAYGIISTLYPMLVNTHFTGEERITVMGLCAAMLQGGRLVTYLIGGYLAKSHWYDVYFTYLFAVAALVLVALYLPRTPAGRKTGGTRDSGSFRSAGVWRLSFFAAVYACLYFVLSTDGSVYIESGGLGTAALTGWLSSLSCAVAGVSAALYGKINRWLGRATFPAAFLLIGAGYLFAGLHVAVLGAAVAFFAGALGISLFTPWLMTAISDAAGQASAPVSTAIVLTCTNVGYFLSPYVSAPLARLLGGGAPASFTVFGILSLVFAAVSAFQCRRQMPI